MNGGRVFGVLQTDSTPWPVARTMAAPVLAACPVAMPGGVAAFATMQAMYREAYERALAAARPSRYELALAAFPN